MLTVAGTCPPSPLLLAAWKAIRTRSAAEGGECYRHEKDGPVQDGDEHRRPAPNERFAALAPQLPGGRECIAGNDERTHQNACGGRTNKFRGIAGDQPEHRPAMKQARGAPDHADGDKQQHITEPGWRLRCKQGTEPPQRAGESTDQIRRSPPRQRLDAFLAPCKQQDWPSNKVTLIAMMNNVPISTDIDSMQHVLTRYGKMLTISPRRAQKIWFSGFAVGLAGAEGFQVMRRKLGRLFSRLGAENCASFFRKRMEKLLRNIVVMVRRQTGGRCGSTVTAAGAARSCR
jgi:hypothetical protein